MRFLYKQFIIDIGEKNIFKTISDTFMSISIAKKMTDVIPHIMFLSTNNAEIIVSLNEAKPDIFYPDNKFTVDISKYVPEDFDLAEIVFFVKNKPLPYFQGNCG